MAYSNKEQRRLKDKYGPWALVTGASSGIGKALAEKLAEAGLNLILVARRGNTLENLARDLESVYGIESIALPFDLSEDNQTKTLIRELNDFDIGLLVAAAGFGTSGEFADSDLEVELNMLKVNNNAVLILSHYFSQAFAGKARGGMILFGSIVGFQGVPYSAHYAATKGYIQSLGEGLAQELRAKGVDVLTVAPGPVESGFAERSNLKMDMSMKAKDIAVPILKALGRRNTVRPGFLSKFLIGSLSILPRWGRVRMMKLIMGGMTKHQRA